MFEREFVARVTESTDLAAVVSEHVALRPRGGRLFGLCPFHHERTPSFSVLPDRGFYICFGCNASGDAIAFVRAVNGWSFTEAVSWLAYRAGIPVENGPGGVQDWSRNGRLARVVEMAAEFYADCLAGPRGGRAREVVSRRCPDPVSEVVFRLGWAPDTETGLVEYLAGFADGAELLADAEEAGLIRSGSGGPRDVFVDRVMMPIATLTGTVVGFSGRALDTATTPKYLHNRESAVFKKSSLLYGMGIARRGIGEAGYAVICEGNFDVVAAFTAGVRNVVATCGTSLSDSQVAVLSRVCSRVLLAFDADSAGSQATLATTAKLVAAGFAVHTVELPANAKDIGDLVGNPSTIRVVLDWDQTRPALTVAAERLASRLERVDPQDRAMLNDDVHALISAAPDPAARGHLFDVLAAVDPGVRDRVNVQGDSQPASVPTPPLHVPVDVDFLALAVLVQNRDLVPPDFTVNWFSSAEFMAAADAVLRDAATRNEYALIATCLDPPSESWETSTNEIFRRLRERHHAEKTEMLYLLFTEALADGDSEAADFFEAALAQTQNR